MRFLVSIADGLSTLKDIPPLLFRLILAYGFYGPFLTKWHGIDGFAQFLQSMDYPLPLVSAYLAMITEGLGVLFLFFGFATRLISVPLMFMMVLAIITVHMPHGYDPAANGFAIPLLYFLMLFNLLIVGPGKVSIDAILTGRIRCEKKGRGCGPNPPHPHS
jgi:putative oxidoreductase